MYVELGNCRPLDPLGGKNRGWYRFSLFLFLDSGDLVIEMNGLRYNPETDDLRNVYIGFVGKTHKQYITMIAVHGVLRDEVIKTVRQIIEAMPGKIDEFREENGRKPTFKETMVLWTSLKRVVAGHVKVPTI